MITEQGYHPGLGEVAECEERLLQLELEIDHLSKTDLPGAAETIEVKKLVTSALLLRLSFLCNRADRARNPFRSA